MPYRRWKNGCYSGRRTREDKRNHRERMDRIVDELVDTIWKRHIVAFGDLDDALVQGISRTLESMGCDLMAELDRKMRKRTRKRKGA